MSYDDHPIFAQLITLAEVRRQWRRSRSNIMLDCDLGLIAARRIGRDWLLVRKDVEKRYGRPRFPR